MTELLEGIVGIVGGLTGLVDGALTTEQDIQISTERMTAIESVDRAGILNPVKVPA